MQVIGFSITLRYTIFAKILITGEKLPSIPYITSNLILTSILILESVEKPPIKQ